MRGCENKGAEDPKNRQTEYEVGMEVRQRRALSGRRLAYTKFSRGLEADFLSPFPNPQRQIAYFFLKKFTQPRGEANSLFLSRNIYTASRQIAYFFLDFYPGAARFPRKFSKMRVEGQANFSHFPAFF